MNDKDETTYDEVDAARLNERLISEEEQAGAPAEAEPPAPVNVSLVETDVHFVGDRTVIAQIVQLLSYIRHALRGNAACRIALDVGTEQANVDLNFDANGCAVPDLVPPAEFRIN